MFFSILLSTTTKKTEAIQVKIIPTNATINDLDLLLSALLNKLPKLAKSNMVKIIQK